MKQQLILAAVLALASGAAFADGDAANGGKLFDANGCAGCHGSNAVSAADQPLHAPILAGQYKDYLIQALHEYKKGERKAAVMNGVAGSLSDQDIKDLAEYLAALPGPLGVLPKP